MPAATPNHDQAAEQAAGRTARGRRVRRAAASVVPAAAALAGASPAYAAPTPGNVQPPGTQGLNTMLDWGGWGVSFVCVAGILVVAAMMALKHRRGEGGGEAMGSLGWVLGACVLLSAAGPLANALT